jgi:hypothetical protein
VEEEEEEDLVLEGGEERVGDGGISSRRRSIKDFIKKRESRNEREIKI